jgi:hypothetical protein
MPQPKITNNTVCECQALFTNDETMRPIVAPIIKATFGISMDGKLTFADKQLPIILGGEHGSYFVHVPYWGIWKTETWTSQSKDRIYEENIAETGRQDSKSILCITIAFTEDVYVTGKEGRGEAIAELRTSPARRDASLSTG